MASVLSQIQNTPALRALIIVGFTILVLQFIELVFRVLGRRVKTQAVSPIHVNFFKSCLKAFFVVACVISVGYQFEAIAQFYNTILMSSSLLIVVMGFVMQEGLSNIVHGLIISIFRPFELGDRVKVVIDGNEISGYVESITLRNTVIINVLNSARVIVPNAKMDLGIVENSYAHDKKESSNYVDLCITYDSDIDLACQLVADVIYNHPLFIKRQPGKEATEVVNVMARELGTSGIELRAFMVTETIEDNFVACSDVRKAIVRRVNTMPGVELAYTTLRIKNDEEEAIQVNV